MFVQVAKDADARYSLIDAMEARPNIAAAATMCAFDLETELRTALKRFPFTDTAIDGWRAGSR